jgi:hypothetical protein
MHLNVGKEVAALQRMTVKELRAKYAEVFGEETPTHNKAWLVKRIAWRIQALAEGGHQTVTLAASRRGENLVREFGGKVDLRGLSVVLARTILVAETLDAIWRHGEPQSARQIGSGDFFRRRDFFVEGGARCEFVDAKAVMAVDEDFAPLHANFARGTILIRQGAPDNSSRPGVQGVDEHAIDRPITGDENNLSVRQRRPCAGGPGGDQAIMADDFSCRRAAAELPEQVAGVVQAVEMTIIRADIEMRSVSAIGAWRSGASV